MVDPYFVTLSRPNCTWDQLSDEIKYLNDKFGLIRGWFRTKKNRGLEISLDGIKKFETTYSIDRNDFHPHIHLLVDGRINAYTLLGQWFRLVDGAGGYGNDIRKADEGSIKELFKYMTKFWKVESKGNDEKFIVFPPEVLDHIMKAMKGKQVFKSFGKIKKVDDVVPDDETLDVDGVKDGVYSWEWDKDSHDWINDDGELFTGYQPNIREQKIYKAIEYSQGIRLKTTNKKQ